MMKQVIMMRTDLHMSVGKMCAQAAHASIDTGVPCVVLKVTSEDELINVLAVAQRLMLTVSHIKDAGHTEVEPGTLTCGAIYGKDELVNKVTGQYPLL